MSTLKIANDLLRSGKLEEALAVYKAIRAENPLLSKTVAANIAQIERTIALQQQAIEAARAAVIAKTPLSIAVVFHVFHETVVDEIAQRLAFIGQAFDLYVTSPLGREHPAIESLFRQFPGCHYVYQPNRGRDVLPFLNLLADLQAYDLCLKLHTKKGVTSYGDLWRKMTLNALLGSAASVQETMDCFKLEPELMIAGPELFYGSGKKLLFKNRPNIKTLCQMLGFEYVESREWGFFAGTMFWCRPRLYAELAAKVDQIEFEPEQGWQDGGMAHAVERIFGLIPSYQQNKALMLAADLDGYIGQALVDLPGSPHSIQPVERLNVLAKAYLAKDGIKGDINRQRELFQDDMHIRGWLAKTDDALPRAYVLKIGEDVFTGVADEYSRGLEDNAINQGCHAYEVLAPVRYANGTLTKVTLFDAETGLPAASADYCWRAPVRSYTNFAGFLAASYTNPLVAFPFVDADQAAFTVMQQLALDLQQISANTRRKPLISIVMPVLDAALLQRAVESVIHQSYAHWELLVIDAESRPKVRSTLKACADPRLKYVPASGQGDNLSTCRNAGLQVAKGEYMAYLDSDKTWDPGFLAAMHGAMCSLGSDVAALYSGQCVIGDSAQPYEAVRFGLFNRSLLRNKNTIDLCCLMHKKTIHGFDSRFETTLEKFSEWAFVAKLASVVPMYGVPVLLAQTNADAEQRFSVTAGSEAAYEQARLLIDVHLNPVVQPASAVTQDKRRGLTIVVRCQPEWGGSLGACLTALTPYMGRKDVEVMLVGDNRDPDDNSAATEFLAQHGKRARFLKAHVGEAFATARKSYDVVLLDSDVVVAGDTLDRLQAVLYSQPQWGAAGPAMVLPANTAEIKKHVPYATLDAEVDTSISADLQNLKQAPLFYSGGPLVVDFLRRGCVMMKRQVIQDCALSGQFASGLDVSERALGNYLGTVQGYQLVVVPDAACYVSA